MMPARPFWLLATALVVSASESDPDSSSDEHNVVVNREGNAGDFGAERGQIRSILFQLRAGGGGSDSIAREQAHTRGQAEARSQAAHQEHRVIQEVQARRHGRDRTTIAREHGCACPLRSI